MKYLFVLILFFSCQEREKKLDYLESYIYKNWASVSYIEVGYPERFSPGKSIIDPQMTWKNLLHLKNSDSTHCLFYRIPHRRLNKGRGILKIVKMKINENCDRALSKKSELKINSITHLKLYFTTKFEQNLITKNKFKPFHLYISAVGKNGKDWSLEIPFYNVTSKSFLNPNKLSKKIKKFKRYDEPWKETLKSGVSVFNEDFLFEKNEIQTQTYNYNENKVKFCYRINPNCEVIQNFECQKCTGGWYSIVDYNCAGGGSKLCGIAECGGANSPACPRGNTFEEITDNNFCFRGSKAGICNEGLETYCDGNNVLVCR